MKKDSGLRAEDVTLVWLQWPEACFRVTAGDLAYLRAHVRGRVVSVRSEASFLRYLPQATCAICWNFGKEWFARAPKLRVLATPAAGRELLPSDAELPSGVRRINGAFHGEIMSETVLACLFAHARGLTAAQDFQRAGAPWPRVAMSTRCFRVAGTKAVILGYGKIGHAVARKLAPLGVTVTGITRRNLSALRSELRDADWLIACLPSDTGTDDLVDARVFRAMKRTAVFVNVGRGNCTDEVALAHALRTRRIAGAYLDVFKNEPLTAASPLAAELPGLVRLPHASAFAPDYLRLFFGELVRALAE